MPVLRASICGENVNTAHFKSKTFKVSDATDYFILDSIGVVSIHKAQVRYVKIFFPAKDPFAYKYLAHKSDINPKQVAYAVSKQRS